MPVALIAGDIDIGEEVHVDLQLPIALAFFATATGGIEAEASRIVAAHPGHGELGKELANRRKHLGVGGGIGAGTAPDGALVDDDDFVDALEAGEAIMLPWSVFGTVKMPLKGAHEDGIDQR